MVNRIKKITLSQEFGHKSLVVWINDDKLLSLGKGNIDWIAWVVEHSFKSE